MTIKKRVKFYRLFHFTKVLRKPSLKGLASLSNILHSIINFSSSYNKSSDEVQSISLIMKNCLPFTVDVMVALVHKCVQQTHLLTLHLETIGHILRLLNALNGLVYSLIKGDPRGDNLMIGSSFRKLLTELEGV